VSTYTVKKLPGEPIIYCWMSETWKASELPAVFEQVAVILDVSSEPLILITSAQNIDLTLDDMIATASFAAGGSDSLLHHPKLQEFIFVTTVRKLQLAAKTLDSDAFGNVPVKIFDSEDEAFVYARARIAGE
jgi:hypothetical protein